MARDGPIHEFEAAVEAVINGDLTELEASLCRNPTLVHARSFCDFRARPELDGVADLLADLNAEN